MFLVVTSQPIKIKHLLCSNVSSEEALNIAAFVIKMSPLKFDHTAFKVMVYVD